MGLSTWQGRTAFLAGTFGGATPFILRIALGLSNRDDKAVAAIKDPWWILGIIALGLIGGGLAAVWKETDMKKAFQLGVGLPSLLTVLNTSASVPPALIVPPDWFHLNAVYAAGPPVTGRKLKFEMPPEVSSSSSSMTAVFKDSAIRERKVSFTADNEIDVPNDASTVEAKSDLFEADSVTLPAQSNVLIVVAFKKVEKKALYGFLYSIGIQGHAYKLRQPNITTTALAKP